MALYVTLAVSAGCGVIVREISLDTETTGLSFADGDRLVEIGCVEIIDKRITGRNLHVYINPEREMSEDASRITGLTYGFLKQFPPFKEVAAEFLEFIAGDRLVIHNAPFDMGFLNNELKLSGLPLLDTNNVVDTLVMAREKFPGSPSTLDALCRRFSVDSSSRTKHGALIDAELLAEVYLCMSVEQRQGNLFGSLQPKSENVDTYVEFSRHSFEHRSFPPNADELELHKAFLQKLRDPIWNKLSNTTTG